MVDRIEKVVYVTEGGQEFKDYNEAHKAEAIERLTKMLHEINLHASALDEMAKVMLTRYVELRGIVDQYQDESE